MLLAPLLQLGETAESAVDPAITKSCDFHATLSGETMELTARAVEMPKWRLKVMATQKMAKETWEKRHLGFWEFFFAVVVVVVVVAAGGDGDGGGGGGGILLVFFVFFLNQHFLQHSSATGQKGLIYLAIAEEGEYAIDRHHCSFLVANVSSGSSKTKLKYLVSTGKVKGFLGLSMSATGATPSLSLPIGMTT